MVPLSSSRVSHAFGLELALLHSRPLLLYHHLSVGAGELLDVAPLGLG